MKSGNLNTFLAGLLAVTTFTGLQSQSFSDLGNLQIYEGFFDFYYQEAEDRILMVVDRLEEEFLYVHSLSAGVGHNDLGLDRGQLGGEAVVHFRKAGDRILMVRPNLDYRAESDNPDERTAVEQAFARSVLYGFPVLDRDGDRYLVDLTGMLFSDAHRVADRLQDAGQGTYHVERDLSALELERTRAFPDNVEFDAMLTFTGKPEGNLVRQVTPDARHVTVNQHHSFVRLPDDGYTPREYHPGSGCIYVSWMDYASPLNEPLKKRYIVRHRLEKKHPEKEVSEPVEPIVYYLDPGTPEPVRTALLEGAGWWEEAFRDIGFENAYRVEMLPEGADPMDVRYNVIQWVHRSTRGWSYGYSVNDPRTGEIIKGHVSLGSLRVRQDLLIAQALLNRPFEDAGEGYAGMEEMALARIRQLSAHEVGHTLGFVHNYAASSRDRASVMDYPHPLVYVDNGQVKLDRAYAAGMGAWDKVTVAYAYSEFNSPAEEKEGLKDILASAADKGLRYITDYDARATGGAHPDAHLWDNGASAVDELHNILKVRETAIRHFGTGNLRDGLPVSLLEDVFVPLYFFHRYQTEAAAKLVGGLKYTYSVKGDGSAPPEPLEADVQDRALEAILETLSPGVLMIPESKLEFFPPRAPGYMRTRESFKHRTGVTFDYLAPPSAAANMTLQLLLHPERANRLLLQHGLDEDLPGIGEVTGRLVDHCFGTMGREQGYEARVAHAVRFILIDHLLRLAESEEVYPQVKAQVREQLSGLKETLESAVYEGTDAVIARQNIRQIDAGKAGYLEHIPEPPPGSPIGMGCMH